MKSLLGKNLNITEEKKKSGVQRKAHMWEVLIVCINTYSLRRSGLDLRRDNDVQGKWIRYKTQAQAVNMKSTGSNVAAFI